MTVSNGDIIKLVVEAILDEGTIVQNVYYLLAELAAPQADQSILNALETWVESAYGNLTVEMSNTVTFQDIVADIIEWDTDHWETTYHIGTEDIDTVPAGTGDPFPNQVSAFATFNTTRPKSKGRKFLFPFDELMALGSYLTAPAVSSIVDYAADILTTIVLGPFNELVPGIVRSSVNEFLEFRSAVVTNVLGTQRRRRPGVGI